MSEIKFDDTVDITDVVCPVTFVKAKVALEELDEGQVLSIRMNDGEPVQNVPRSIKEEGHQILKLDDNEDGKSETDRSETMAERLNSETFKEKAFQPGKLTLIDFYSDSCVPCKRMVPVFAKLEEKYGDQIYIGKINVAYEQNLVEEYKVMSAPTLIFLKDGKQIERLTGAKKAAELEEIIDKNI